MKIVCMISSKERLWTSGFVVRLFTKAQPLTTDVGYVASTIFFKERYHSWYNRQEAPITLVLPARKYRVEVS